ncbi:GDSL-type esterase/lipase family protein [Streptomyces sp. NPDC057496]|uniref:GDSL-type esterase/lipase family protein n=1 Tax=Streptomyces sp. NPDC057496 TaxID=3346149 RepID=UPI00369403CA
MRRGALHRALPPVGWAARVAAAHIGRDEAHDRFFDLAVPGATIGEVLRARLPEAPDRSPDTVIIAAGINDLVRNHEQPLSSVGDVVVLVEQVAEAVESRGARPVVIGPLRHDEQRIRTEFGADLPRDSVLGSERESAAWSERTHVSRLHLRSRRARGPQRPLVGRAAPYRREACPHGSATAHDHGGRSPRRLSRSTQDPSRARCPRDPGIGRRGPPGGLGCGARDRTGAE